MTPELSVVIPVRLGSNPYVSLSSIARQYVDHEVIISRDHESRGANWARNRGAELARGEFILFCDDDIQWRPGAIHAMISTLDSTPEASYAYGSYGLGFDHLRKVQCGDQFDPNILRRRNYISTMSVIRRAHFPGFDESIHRLQDWDLWLTMLADGRVGVQVGKLLFDTAVRKGITHDGPVPYEEAKRRIAEKHGLPI